MSNSLKMASCRSKKSFLTDVKNMVQKIDEISFELNECSSKHLLASARRDLFCIIQREGFEISTTKRLIKNGTITT